MDNFDLSNPLNAHRSELLGVLSDAVKLEFEVRRIRDNPREEDMSRFYTAQSALDEKCRALSRMPETRLSQLRSYDYIDSLVHWSAEVLNMTSKYMKVQDPLGNPLDFWHTHQTRSTDTPFTADDCALWIEHLEKRVGISDTYLERVSRKDLRAKSVYEFTINPDGQRGAANMVSTDAPSLDSPVEEGELQEQSLWHSNGQTSKCSELLQRVTDFHESHGRHKATLTTVADEVQKVLRQKKARAFPAIDDPETFRTQANAEVMQVVSDDMPGILNAIRLEFLLQSSAFRGEVYTNVWESIQPILDIAESAHTQVRTGRQHATFQSN